MLAGRVVACRFVQQACRRQRDDLLRFRDHPIYTWAPERAGRACRFFELMPHIKGPRAFARPDGTPNTIHLEDWQCFVATTVFGWRRKDTGGRRFRRVYVEVPRGNAKSTLSSAVGLFGLAADDEEGPEVYSAATTRDQAKIVYGDAKSMLRKVPGFATRLRLAVNEHVILCLKNNGKFEPLSREAKSLDGKNVHVGIIDELHAHPTREVYDVLETAMAKRLASLLWCITTAGSDTSGICYEIRTYCTKLLDGSFTDETQFAIIYTIDEGDDWMDPAVWRKANPNWGVSVMPDEVTALAQKAQQSPAAQANFKTKHLDVWVNAAMAWMDMRAWDRAADPTLLEKDFEQAPALARGGEAPPCFVGLDLASKTDLVARAHVFTRDLPKRGCRSCGLPQAGHDPALNHPFEPDDALERHFYLFVRSYLPEAAIADGRNAQYRGWEAEGFLQATPGDVIEFARVEEELVQDRDRYRVLEVAYDPWQATQLAQNLTARGFDGADEHGSGPKMVELRATTQNYSAPMKEIDALVRAGRFHHDGNPLMRWMVSNVVCYVDAKENIYPRKERPEMKIDGVVAAIAAVNRAMVHVGEEGPYSETRGIRSL